MVKKPKFKPRITRVKLNPEQAVLACDCYTSGTKVVGDYTPSNNGEYMTDLSWPWGVVVCSLGRFVGKNAANAFPPPWSAGLKHYPGTATSS